MKRLTLKKIEDTVKELMEKEDRKDVEFRHIIAVSEVGDVGKYITHDPELNPNARPHGTKEDEVLAYGQAFVQLAALSYLRGISIKDAFDRGLQNWLDADWRKSESSSLDEKVLKGIGVRGESASGLATGEAYIVRGRSPKEDVPTNKILVIEYATPEFASYVKNSVACVSNHGGATCHLANIAREFGIPCVLGTGDATERVKEGQEIIVDPDAGLVYI